MPPGKDVGGGGREPEPSSPPLVSAASTCGGRVQGPAASAGRRVRQVVVDLIGVHLVDDVREKHDERPFRRSGAR